MVNLDLVNFTGFAKVRDSTALWVSTTICLLAQGPFTYFVILTSAEKRHSYSSAG